MTDVAPRVPAAPASTPTSTSTPVPADAAAVAARLRVSATRLARQLRQESDAGLSPSQLSALTSVERHGPLTLGRLAEQERVAPPSVTKVVAKLEEAGLVERRLDEHDRRVAWVAITGAGATRLAKIRQRKTEYLAARLAKLSEHDRRRLADALDALDSLTADPAPTASGRTARTPSARTPSARTGSVPVPAESA